MAIGNWELMHECFPKHPRMGTARQKLDNETEEENKKRINAERSTADTKERSPVQSPCRVIASVTHDSQSRSLVTLSVLIIILTAKVKSDIYL